MTNHSSLALETLSVAQELCARAAGTRGTRQAYFIGRLMAREHLVSGDAKTAHRLLLLVAGEGPDTFIACASVRPHHTTLHNITLPNII